MPTLQQLAEHPIITYDRGYTGRSHIDDAFAKEGLSPNVVITAMDADVIARHPFEINVTRLAVWCGNWLRGYAYSFI